MASEDTRPNTNHPDSGNSPSGEPGFSGSRNPGEETIPLPTSPLQQKLPVSLSERAYFSGIDRLLVLLTLALAFVLSAFSIRNSDIYQHLAVGKLLASGEYRFGEDPFSWASQPLSWANNLTGDKIVWVNHSWLFDFLTYGLYSLDSSGALLIIIKAILVMIAIGLILLAGRQIGRSLFIPTICAALAAMVMSPRLFYQPIVLSITLEALTIYLLERPRLNREIDPGRSGRGSWLLLPLVFIAWVNLDHWFPIGLVTVAIYFLGAVVQSIVGPKGGVEKVNSPFILGFLLIVCILACLINPYHVHALTIPEQLGFSPAAETIMNDKQLIGLFASPFQPYSSSFFSSYGVNPAVLSYFVLVVTGLISFGVLAVMNRSEFRWDRLLLFLFMTFLSGYSARAIPLMAVATASSISLNFLDATAIAARNSFNPATLQSMLVLRSLALLVLVLVSAASAVGMTQARPQIARRLGFQMIVEPSRKALVEKVASLRKDKLIPDNIHWFTTHIDLMNYFSWFCPGEKTSFDQRYYLFNTAAEDFIKVRDSLVDIKPLPPGTEPAWREVFRRNKVRFVLAQEDNLFGRPILIEKILSNPREWTLLFLNGRNFLVVWNDPALQGTEQARKESLEHLQWSSEKEAFGPHALVAQPSGPEREPRERAWIDEVWDPLPIMPSEAFQGKACGIYFNSRIPADFERLMQSIHTDLARQILSLGSLQANPEFTFPQLGVALASQLRLVVSINDLATNRRPPPNPARPQDIQPMDMEAKQILENRFNFGDMGPQGAPYLALRSLRQALAISPDNARLYSLLGETYLLLGRNTQERSFNTEHPLLTSIREIQAMAAFYQAAKLDPDSAEYHGRLSDLYLKNGYFDLAVNEQKELIRCLKLQPDSDPEKQKIWEREIDSMDRKVKTFEENFKNNQENPYLVQASDKEDLLEKAALAMSPQRPAPWLSRKPIGKPFGIAEKALETLRQIPADKMVQKGVNGPESPALVAQIDLLLRIGRLKDAADTLHPSGTDTLRKLMGPHRGIRISRDDRFFLPAFETFEVLIGASKGIWEQTDQAMEDLIQVACGPEKLKGISSQVGMQLGQILLEQAAQVTRIGPTINLKPNPMFLLQDSFLVTLQQVAIEADLLTIRGWLALETGHIDKAKLYLEKADSLVEQHRAQRLEYPLHGLAKMGLRWIKENQ